jgi:hypothetical protein
LHRPGREGGFSPASERRRRSQPALFSQEELSDMRSPEPEADASRAESVTAALLYLMTHYARTGCPRLALCVSRHMHCLATHPDAAPVVRDICAALHGAWSRAAAEEEADSTPLH